MTEEKSNEIIECFGNIDNWEGWSEKLLARRRKKGYCTLLIYADQNKGINKVPTKEEYDQAVGSVTCKWGSIQRFDSFGGS